MTTFVWRLWGTSYNSLKYLTPLAHTRAIKSNTQLDSCTASWAKDENFRFVSSWFQVDLIWFDSLWFDDAPRRKKLKLKLHIAAAIESNQANETPSWGPAWLNELSLSWQSGKWSNWLLAWPGLVRAWLAWLFSLYDICLVYRKCVSQWSQPASTLHNSVLLLLSTCIYEVETRSRSTNYRGVCGMRTVIRLSGRQCSLLLLR